MATVQSRSTGAAATPEGAITDQAKANFRDGVLEITIPAPPASRGRRLQIGSETRSEANAPAHKK